jgi:hypothetical protein
MLALEQFHQGDLPLDLRRTPLSWLHVTIETTIARRDDTKTGLGRSIVARRRWLPGAARDARVAQRRWIGANSTFNERFPGKVG